MARFEVDHLEAVIITVMKDEYYLYSFRHPVPSVQRVEYRLNAGPILPLPWQDFPKVQELYIHHTPKTSAHNTTEVLYFEIDINSLCVNLTHSGGDPDAISQVGIVIPFLHHTEARRGAFEDYETLLRTWREYVLRQLSCWRAVANGAYRPRLKEPIQVSSRDLGSHVTG